MQRSVIVKAGVALAVLWCVVLAVAKIAGDQRVTPESVLEFAKDNILDPPPENGEPEDAEARREVIREYADRVNRLSWKQRRELREMGDDNDRPGRKFFENLTKSEQHYAIELTVDAHFKSVMEAFNEMETGERKKLIVKITKDMRANDQGRRDLERLEKEDEEILDKVINSGMRAYYQEADADVKLDLAPLMEEMQGRMQRLRR